ncbi:hypothetical protein EYF80_001108 [Liparis tanakae]|uniref:Uncharacterized protein n=1 Tax=Liparis tanakae TaxID=230148 RepID=A0A4Z2JEV3_9TELE|nr:hypothetical protein EYF80_001108 [Liparis tanakae]
MVVVIVVIFLMMMVVVVVVVVVVVIVVVVVVVVVGVVELAGVSVTTSLERGSGAGDGGEERGGGSTDWNSAHQFYICHYFYHDSYCGEASDVLHVSRASKKSLENFSPNSTSGLQPPHSQESWGPGRSAGKCSMTPCTIPFPRWMASSCKRCSLIRKASSSPRRFSSQLHAFSLPMEHALATACTTPAAAMAYAKALSLKPAGGKDRIVAGAVPTVSSELVLALVDGNLDSLNC